MGDDALPDDRGDERADRRDQRRAAERGRMRKHGARTGAVYRDAILKRLRKGAGVPPAPRRRRRKGR